MTAHSAEPSRTSPYSNDLRYRMIFQTQGMGLTCEEVAKNLCVDTSTVYRMVSKFNTTGELRPNKNWCS